MNEVRINKLVLAVLSIICFIVILPEPSISETADEWFEKAES